MNSNNRARSPYFCCQNFKHFRAALTAENRYPVESRASICTVFEVKREVKPWDSCGHFEWHPGKIFDIR